MVHLKDTNDQVFNGKDVVPMDTLQLASIEAECWRKANLHEDTEDEESRIAPRLV